MNPAPPASPLDLFASLLQLEKLVLEAQTLPETRFVITNATRQLSPFIQAILLTGRPGGGLQTTSLSNISEVDRSSPFLAWTERLAKHLTQSGRSQALHPLTPDELTPELRREWVEFASASLLWIPLMAREGQMQGALLLGREEAWSNQETALLGHLSIIYAHALERFQRHHQSLWARWRLMVGTSVATVGLVLAALIPVRLSVLAPAEIVAADPFVVTAPLDGVIRELKVRPNEAVQTGRVLAELESGDLRGIQDVAAKALEVTQAERRRSQQASFLDPSRKADLAPMQAQVDLKTRELALAQSRLSKTQLKADRDGVVVIDDPQLWKGRPVRVGERIMSIADPKRIEVTIWVPVKDAVALEAGNEIRLFLDTDPLRSLRGTVKYVVYESTLAGEWPAYKVNATLDAQDAAPRIGLRGTARIYGGDTTLFYYLLRRPITAARQWLGW